MDRYSDRHLGVCYFIILFLFCMRFTIAGVETQKKKSDNQKSIRIGIMHHFHCGNPYTRYPKMLKVSFL